MDLCERVVAAVDAGMTQPEAAAWFGVSARQVRAEQAGHEAQRVGAQPQRVCVEVLGVPAIPGHARHAEVGVERDGDPGE